MLRPVSPPPRRSDVSRPNSPGPAQLRRSSSDVSNRPNRFLAKLKNASGTTSSSSTSSPGPIPASKLSPRSHSKADSISALDSRTPLPTISSSKTSKSSREMHRLGTIPAQVALAPAMAAAASASSLSLASTAAASINASSPGSSTNDPWHMLHVHVLPLFNGEALSIPIEDLNQLVKKRIGSVVSRSPSRAVSTLEQDVIGLLAAGMITLNVKLSDAKLSELGDEKIILRVVEVWDFFWHQVLPYVEGVFHPLHTDKLIRTLFRPRTHRSSSPTLPDEAHTTSSQSIDIRTLALRSFRDSILLPIFPRMHALLGAPRKDKASSEDGKVYNHPRLQQMLLVLTSTAQHSPSLTTLSPPPSPGENAVTQLLRAIRNPHAAAPARPFSVTRLPSFFAGSAPRDRRGRIARKSMRYTTLNLAGTNTTHAETGDGADDETPRNSGFGDERDRERAFLESLESLRSPELDVEELGGVGAGAGGWGLGGGEEHHGDDEDEDEEAMDWDQAQDVVERMVGLRA